MNKIKVNIQNNEWGKATANWGSTQTVVDLTTNGVNFYNILKWGQEEKCSLFEGI